MTACCSPEALLLIPIGTARLLAVFEWLQLDAAGEKKPNEASVFRNEAGEPLGSFRTAWVTAVLRAHGIKPAWKARGWSTLTAECLESFRRIDLHWHDLRHEYASRLVERGVPLAQVRDLLGHASILTTERYDNQTLENLQAAAAKLEAGERFEVPILRRFGVRPSTFFQEDRLTRWEAGGGQARATRG